MALPAPVPEPAAVGMPVIKYEEDARSINLAVKAENNLAKRSGSSVYLTCYFQTDCTQVAYVHQASGFDTNQPCINAANCQCMIIKTLDNAHIKFWNGQTCSGNESGQNGCFINQNVVVSSPGTNSIGFHVGCTGN
ncbi:hypothetical protein MMC30_003278 [Trapelia coarctata]|nr:hypothetical protein [Trapelia coarctata]